MLDFIKIQNVCYPKDADKSMKRQAIERKNKYIHETFLIDCYPKQRTLKTQALKPKQNTDL